VDKTYRRYDAAVLHHVRTGEGPPLLVAHGIGMSGKAFDGVVPLLADRFEVVAVDLPGFGQSPPLPGPPTLRALADACAEVMGGDRFHVAGNSLGGGVALHLALDGRALSACALSPIGFMEGWERAFAQVSLMSARLQAPAAPFLVGTIGRFGAVRRALSRQFLEHAERIPVDSLAESYRDLGATRGMRATLRHAINWRAPAVASLPCPVTIAWGAHDRLLLTTPQAARARERMPSARHLLLDDCGHIPNLDDPAQVARVIAESVGAAAPVAA
jgi:pimeloyl-ACP methyl ester carboxylesterase